MAGAPRARSKSAVSKPTKSNTPDYFSPDFDPSTLTKPKLRSILGEHGVTDLPPATVKKEILVELFRERVIRNAHRIKRERSKTKASDKGITFIDKNFQPSPVRGRSRSRKSIEPSSLLPSDDLSITSSPTRPKKERSISKNKTKILNNQSLTDSIPFSLLQRTLPSVADSPRAATAKLHSRLEYIASVNKPSLNSAHKESGLAALLERVKQHSSTYLVDNNDRYKRWRHKFEQILLAILFLTCALLCSLYIGLKLVNPAPYCNGSSSDPLKFSNDTSFRGVITCLFYNGCLPCPPHATCKNSKLYCDEKFVAQNNWLALGKSCVPDLLRLAMVEEMIAKTQILLADRLAAVECGLTSSKKHELSEAELFDHLRPLVSWSKQKKFGSKDLEQTWAIFNEALDEMEKNQSRMKIVVSKCPIQNNRILVSKWANFSLYCRIKLYAQGQWDSAKRYLIPLGIILITISTFAIRWRQKKSLSASVDELVQTVFQILAEQDALHRRDPTIPGAISVHQIRDALFLKASSRARSRLWPAVCRAIACNSNVRECVMSIRGESHRVWEWIGSDVLSPLRRD